MKELTTQDVQDVIDAMIRDFNRPRDLRLDEGDSWVVTDKKGREYKQVMPVRFIGDNEQIGLSAKACRFAKAKKNRLYDYKTAYRYCLRIIGGGRKSGTWEGYAEDAAQDGFIRWVECGGKYSPATCVRSALLNSLQRLGMMQKIHTPLTIEEVATVKESRDNGEPRQVVIDKLPETVQWLARQFAEGKPVRKIREEMGVGRDTLDRMKRQLTEAVLDQIG